MRTVGMISFLTSTCPDPTLGKFLHNIAQSGEKGSGSFIGVRGRAHGLKLDALSQRLHLQTKGLNGTEGIKPRCSGRERSTDHSASRLSLSRLHKAHTDLRQRYVGDNARWRRRK